MPFLTVLIVNSCRKKKKAQPEKPKEWCVVLQKADTLRNLCYHYGHVCNPTTCIMQHHLQRRSLSQNRYILVLPPSHVVSKKQKKQRDNFDDDNENDNENGNDNENERSIVLYLWCNNAPSFGAPIVFVALVHLRAVVNSLQLGVWPAPQRGLPFLRQNLYHIVMPPGG